MSSPHRFPTDFNFEIAFGSDSGNRAHFGADVLKGLVAGIDEHLRSFESTYRFRTLGPALLGAFMWLDDDELIQRIASFPAACVVVRKQPDRPGTRRAERQRVFAKLQELAQRSPGFPAYVFSELTGLAYRVEGNPLVVDPGTPIEDLKPAIPAVRSIGIRQIDRRLVPILHTKMVLLGHLWWHDEGLSGYPEDVIGFTSERLWLGSANATRSSRSNLEFGVWLDDLDLRNGAQRFLAQVMAHSESIDPDGDLFEPDLVEFEYDNAAFAEYLAEFGGDPLDDEDEPPF